MFCWIYKPHMETDYEDDDLERALDPGWADYPWGPRDGWFRAPSELEWWKTPYMNVDYTPRRVMGGH